MPIWVETELKSIMQRYRGRPFNTQTLADFRRELEQLGLSEHYSEAISALAETHD